MIPVERVHQYQHDRIRRRFRVAQAHPSVLSRTNRRQMRSARGCPTSPDQELIQERRVAGRHCLRAQEGESGGV